MFNFYVIYLFEFKFLSSVVLKLQSSQGDNQLNLICEDSGRSRSYILSNATDNQIRDLCQQFCSWFEFHKKQILKLYSLYYTLLYKIEW